jgi:RNA polymerase sigma-54 factor
MSIEMRQFQRMTQDLRMTPQLQQAIKLLQLSRLELADLIQTEMVENPMLEESGDDDGIADNPPEAPARLDERRERETVDGEKAMQEIDWERYLENYSSPLPSSAGSYDEDAPSYDQTITRAEDLTEHLLWQLGVTQMSESERAVADAIIRNLDDDGYLRSVTVDDIAEQCSASLELVEDAIAIVHELDPLGVGARTLQECLLIQANVLFPGDELLASVIRDHLGDIEKRNYSAIARALGSSREAIMEVHRTIQTLDPRPGRQYAPDTTTYVIPDIYIVKQDEEWVPVLNEDGLPRLRVSEYYRKAMRSTSEKDAKNYVQERLRSAWWLIRSIQQRQRTILRVTESIIKFQHDFFERGVEHLKPLVLRDVAEDIGMHESTISRVTTNKYVHTPRGIYELKYFFNSSIRTSEGDDIAAEAVKHRIKALVAEESHTRPLSDQKLAELLLKDSGIEIARRTVAKYREALGILPSSKRRQLL